MQAVYLPVLGNVTMFEGSLAGLMPQGLLALTLNW